MKYYLAHSTIDKDFVKEEIEPKLKKVMEVINPFDYEHWEVVHKKFIEEDSDKLRELANDVVLTDLEHINECDGVIAYVNSPSIGTFMEVFYAARGRIVEDIVDKEVYLICPSKVHRTHPWLLHFSDGIFKNVDELIKEVKL